MREFRGRRHIRPKVDRPTVLLAAGLVAIAALAIALPGLMATSFVTRVPGLQAARDGFALLAALATAGLAWLRFKERSDRDGPYFAGAFTLLAVVTLVDLGLFVSGAGVALGYGADQPGQVPLYSWLGYRFLIGVLMLLGGLAASRRVRRWPRAGRWLTVGPLLLTAGFTALLWSLGSALPVIVPADRLAAMLSSSLQPRFSLTSPAFVLLEGSVTAVYLMAAYVYLRLWRKYPVKTYNAIFGFAAVAAAVSGVYWLATPAGYNDVVTPAGMMLLVAWFLVAAGYVIAIRSDLRQLTRAKAELEQLRRGDAERHQLQERQRLAREMHDGLTQELWLARLTQGQLAEQRGMSTETRELVDRLGATIESAFDESRQMLLGLEPDAGTDLAGLLARLVDYYRDRLDIDIRFELDDEAAAAASHLPLEVKTAVARIAREALNNAAKHARPSTIAVRLEKIDPLRLVVTDDGCGFDHEHTAELGMGLRNMRARAEQLGGRLQISSGPDGGTTVTLDL